MGIRTIMAMIVVAAVSTGCASTYDPLRSSTSSTSSFDQMCGADPPKKYAEGVRCAEEARKAYVDAMVDDTVRSDRVAMALIPLGAAAIGLGVSGVSGAPITGLALGGATIYGGGRWLTSPERRQVFGTGAEACQCVIDASRPLNVREPARVRLDGAIRRLDRTIDALETERKAYAQTASPDPELMKAADDLLIEARTAQRGAVALKGRVDAAGDSIVSAVQSVRLAVTRAAVGTAQDLRDLPDFLKSTVYGTFQDIVGLGPAPSVTTAEQAGVLRTDADKALLRAMEAVRAALDALTLAMNDVSVGDVSTEFARCLDAVKGLKAPVRLRILPSSVVRLAPGQSATILITGGKSPYSVVPLWSESTGLDVTGPPDTNGPARVTIKAADTLTGGPFFLSVRDEQNDVERTVRIETVKKADTKTNPKTGTAASDKDLKAILKALNEKLPASQWTGVAADSAWKTLDQAPQAFRLPFPSADAATAAKQSDNVKRIVKNAPSGLEVTVDKTDLVVTVPTPIAQDLAQKAATGQWP